MFQDEKRREFIKRGESNFAEVSRNENSRQEPMNAKNASSSVNVTRLPLQLRRVASRNGTGAIELVYLDTARSIVSSVALTNNVQHILITVQLLGLRKLRARGQADRTRRNGRRRCSTECIDYLHLSMRECCRRRISNIADT